MSMAPKKIEFNGQCWYFSSITRFISIKIFKRWRTHPFLNSLKLTALTGMNVNYTNAGTYATYGDGTPVNIRMDLTFKEINPIYL